MNEATATLERLKKADKFVRLTFRRNGPKSYRRGQGALLRALLECDGATQRELVERLCMSRRELKDVVKKAERNGYVVLSDADEPRTYTVNLTPNGRAVAQKRLEANERAAEEILSCLDDEERAWLDAIAGKLVLSAESKGISAEGKGRRPARSFASRAC